MDNINISTKQRKKMEIAAKNSELEMELPNEFKFSRSRIMYIEEKIDLEGPAIIGRVYFSRTGKTLYYKGKRFQSLKGRGFKANYYELESRVEYWISGPRKDRHNRLYGGNAGVKIDEDVRKEYYELLSK